MSVKIKVISPEKIIWDIEAQQIILPSITGGVGILENHAPLVTVLQTGLVKAARESQDKWVPLIVWGGVAQVENNEIVVLANGVEEFSELKMTREQADNKVLELVKEIETLKQTNSTDSINKLMLEAEIAKARVEGLSLN